ncbi:hypothetical protein GMD78_12400 [Ornithinibacillus sp. L9]|uniref:Uncharacterized protein n=1 Tax=Ornithinibacillus caprae TaxID=2678566 RepID=A0A6N8FLD5_9BACI|nr:hypothetical protein [Ornithinibacillus caprae]MUK89174.1 hypothetical protein [Ornithinibacillus caprae]
MGKYIRRNAVFNENSERDMKIWKWASDKTGNFKEQNFAAFIRDKLEWCMNNESKTFSEVEQHEQPQKNGWSSLV